MKNQWKGFLCGFALATIIMLGTSSFASTAWKNITVAEDAVNVQINGVLKNIPNFVLDGRTYVQLRSVSDMLGKNVSWDATTNTANIDDSADGKASLNNTQSQDQLTTQQIAKNVDAVVMIETFDSEGQRLGQGSGFIVTADGEIVTNQHVISQAFMIKIITNDQRVFYANVVNYDINKDVAVLKMQNAANMPTVMLGDSGSINLGDNVIAIGNPEGLQNVVSQGIISTVNRLIDGHYYIQTTAAISPGSSGGALFNSNGQVIGITAAQLNQGEEINFAVPINLVKSMLVAEENVD